MMETVLYIGNFDLPDKNAAAHRVLGNGRALRDLGYKLVFVGASETGTDDILDSRFNYDGFDMYSRKLPKSLRDKISFFSNINDYKKVIHNTENVKIVICYDTSAVLSNKLINYCKKNGIICVGDIAEWRSVSGRRLLMKLVKGPDIFISMRFVYKRFEGLIVISDYLKNYYKKQKNIVEIPPLVDSLEAKWDSLAEKEGKELRLVYAGSPGRKDRLDVLVKAVIDTKRDCTLEIVGITFDEFIKLYPEFEHDIINDRVRFKGRLTHEETLLILKKADYSCFFRDITKTSMAGFPTKLVEGITAGTPIITNDTSNIARYVVDNNGILLSDTDIKDIAEAIEKAPVNMNTKRDTFDYRKYVGDFGYWMKKLREE